MKTTSGYAGPSHTFTYIPSPEIKRSTFDRSHNIKTTFDAGKLIPIFADEVIPGDTFSCETWAFGRLSTPIYAVMDNIHIDIHFWYVPKRLLWTNFKKFMGEQDNPGDSTSYLVPQITSATGGFPALGIADYIGVPITATSGTTHSVNAWWHRAYALIWNRFYRDENLQNSVTFNTGDGPDAIATDSLLRRGKRHDYFTSALPFLQKGTAVSLPIGTSAPVSIASDGNYFRVIDGGSVNDVHYRLQYTSPNVTLGDALTTTPTGQVAGDPLKYYSGLTGTANLAAATAATINDLRQAWAIQELYEIDARSGSRYQEVVKGHFGVDVPDAQWQPEYLGGGTVDVSINPVPVTGNDPAGEFPGFQAGYGLVNGQIPRWTRNFVEHGVILGLASARANKHYQQGEHKMFQRRTKLEYFWPALSEIGEQAVLNREIYVDGTAADNQIFGYQERYAEYRYKPSLITGKLRSKDALPLDSWHLAENFASRPALNATFIEENPPIDRVVHTPAEPDFIFDCHFDLDCTRPMPVFGIPSALRRM